jgi:pyruvate/2-oxoglutarate dehydrogenase complex dihydrolipoamide dehydrogenase (E3) component
VEQEFDTVLLATGREAAIASLDLPKANVQLHQGKVG